MPDRGVYCPKLLKREEVFAMRNRRIAFVVLIFGCISFSQMVLNSRLAAIRAVDIVQLLGTGACLGVGLVFGLTSLRRSTVQ